MRAVFSMVRRLPAYLGALVLGTAMLAGTGSAASAAPSPPVKAGDGSSSAVSDSRCDRYADGTGDLCLWYFDHFSGSRVGIYANDSDLADNVFQTPGAGQGRSVKNNAESYYNYDTIWYAHVCVEENYTVECLTIAPGEGGTLPARYANNVESVVWTKNP